MGAVGLAFAGCAGGPTPTAATTYTVPARPEPLASEDVRSVDGCALISAHVLQRVFFHEGPGELHLGMAPDVAGCDVFMSDAGADPAGAGPVDLVYRISPTAWPTAKEWPQVTGGERTSHEGGGWLVVGPDNDAQELYAYLPHALGYGYAGGMGYKVVALKPSPGDVDVRREKAIMSLLLTEASHGSLVTIPWSRGNLLMRDICAAAKTSGLAQALGLTKPRPLVAVSPDARTCEEQATDGDDPRFTVSAGLVTGLDTGAGAVAATVAGHTAVQRQDGKACRVTIAFPGDPALEPRVAEGSPRTTALTVTAQRPCAEVAAVAEPLVAELDRPE